MNRRELLEAASQHLGTAIILWTAEDRLALDVEEIAEWLGFTSLDVTPTPRINH